jgi:group II intron reverse transcriptase/maturase
LQTHIAKAANVEDWRRVSRLQKLLVRSTTAKAVAVRRVTENQGRKTPGVDGVTWSTPSAKREAMDTLESRGYRPKPLRRIHIPKANGGKRPLGIPTMRDRAMLALYWLALDPVAETRGNANSYGFRSGRSTADAVVQCHNALSRAHSPQWVLEGDIRGCFDNISHDWLVRNVPMDRNVLSKWLKAGFVEDRKLFPTDAGTPQGGIISPTLANLVLDGMERMLDSLPRRAKVNFIRYADDFVVTADRKELLETRIKPMIAEFLKERGLMLSDSKTKITHIADGFDFLGWNVRKFKQFLRVVPSDKNAAAFCEGQGQAPRAAGSEAGGRGVRPQPDHQGLGQLPPSRARFSAVREDGPPDFQGVVAVGVASSSDEGSALGQEAVLPLRRLTRLAFPRRDVPARAPLGDSRGAACEGAFGRESLRSEGRGLFRRAYDASDESLAHGTQEIV